MNFTEKFNKAAKLHHSLVCLGLDPDLDLMPKSLMKKKNPLWAFNKEIITETKSKVAAYKLNYAFYLCCGLPGLEALGKTIDLIPRYIPVILDVKTGDIANTMEKYGKAFFEYMKVDAITVNPLMGEDVITPLLKFTDKFFFVLAVTSNRSANDFLKKKSLYKEIAVKIDKWGSKNFGAVVGATNPKEMKEVRGLMPNSLFLVPGIGAQGGNLSDVMTNAIASQQNPLVLINSSRGIIHKSNDDDFAAVAAEETEVLRKAINRFL